jgi:Cytochrome c7 and related cytochrome c
MRTSKLIAAMFVAWVAVVGIAGMRPSAQEPTAAPPAGEYKPPPAPEQPIPYSHKVHLAQGLQCVMCHETVETDDQATLPPTATCMGCHINVKTDSPNIQKLKGFDDKNETVPWRRVYRVPSFVYFSHMEHVTTAKVTCDVCHGNVAQMDVMQKVKDISMAACIECHKSKSARVNCDTCHEVQ